MITATLTSLAKACDLANRPDLSRTAAAIASKVASREWHLVVVGQTSSGKSTLVNTLLDESLLPEDAPPTTGVITFVETHAEGEPRFDGLDPSGEWEPIDRLEFTASAAGGKYHQLRVALNRATPLPPGLIVVDTPGYNSVYHEHRLVLDEYLPNADSVLLLINYRLGFTTEDREFLTVLKKTLGDGWIKQLHIGINFCPAGEPDGRIKEISRKLAAETGHPLPLNILSEAQRAPRRLATGALWHQVANQLNPEARERSVVVNAARLGMALAGELEVDLARREAVLRGKEGDIDALPKRIEEIKAKGEEMSQLLGDAPDRFKTAAATTLDNGLDRIVCRLEEELSKQTWVGIKDCVGYVRSHLIQTGIDETVVDINEEMRRISAALDEELEHLAIELDDLTLIATHIDELGAGKTVSKARDVAAGAAGRRAAVAFLERFGGAAGPKAGVVNLAKTVVRRAGEVVGKRFPRPVYDQMGQVLRRLGITSSRVAATAAAVMIEITAYLYKVKTWKNSLRAVVCRLLGVPFDDTPVLDRLTRRIKGFWSKKHPKAIRTQLLQELDDGIDQAVAGMDRSIEYDVERRVKTLNEALMDRKDRLTGALEDLSGAKAKLSDTMGRLASVKKGSTL